MDNAQHRILQILPWIILLGLIFVAVFSTGLYRIVTLFIIFGALLGWLRATRKGGNLADKFQWAAVHGLILMVVGFVWTIFVAT